MFSASRVYWVVPDGLAPVIAQVGQDRLSAGVQVYLTAPGPDQQAWAEAQGKGIHRYLGRNNAVAEGSGSGHALLIAPAGVIKQGANLDTIAFTKRHGSRTPRYGPDG